MASAAEVQKDLIDRINKTGKYAGMSGMEVANTPSIAETATTNAIESLTNQPTKPIQNVTNNAMNELYPNYTYYVPTHYDAATSLDQGIQNATQMDFAEYMSNTSIDRYMAQLKRNGLNPILAATSGGGASTATSAMSNSTKQTAMNNSTSILSTAMNLIAAIALRKG